MDADDAVPPSAAATVRLTGTLAGPVDGVQYSAAPSGLRGTTQNGGRYLHRAGDVVTFSLPTQGQPIVLGRHRPTTSSTLVGGLPNGMQVAAVLHALDHGSGEALDVSHTVISRAVAAEIRTYLDASGMQGGRFTSDDAFLRHLQQSTTAPAPVRVPVAGAGISFLTKVVMPGLLASAQEHGTLVSTNGRQSRLAGIVTDRSTGQRRVSNCDAASWTGGGTTSMDIRVAGNLLRPGRYAARVASGSYGYSYHVGAVTCRNPNGSTFLNPAYTYSGMGGAYNGDVVVVSDGTRISILGALTGGSTPACSGETRFSGSISDLGSPVFTLRGVLECTTDLDHQRVVSTVQLAGGF